MNPRWGFRIWLGLMVGAIIMGGCASPPKYNCEYWTQFEPDMQAKREYCFPDCPSCGPVIRSRNPYEGLKRDVEPQGT